MCVDIALISRVANEDGSYEQEIANCLDHDNYMVTISSESHDIASGISCMTVDRYVTKDLDQATDIWNKTVAICQLSGIQLRNVTPE